MNSENRQVKQSFGTRLVVMLALSVAVEAAYCAENQRITGYVIYGQTWDALKREMDIKGPRGFYGWTLYEINWRYQWSETPDSCRLTSVNVDADFEIVMPEWRDRPRAGRALQWHWRRFYDELLEHEQQHARMVVAGAADIRRGLTELEERANCHQLEVEANQLGHRILERVKRENEQFDARTDHGRKSGTAC